MDCNKKFFHTINLKAAVALATMGFKMNFPPVTRLVRTEHASDKTKQEMTRFLK